MSKFEEIKNKAKEKVNEAVDAAKNYDYKGKAEELKEKTTEMVDKAKEYDYKEKVTEATEAVKDFDYEGKAKEAADAIKNYDYKAEAENIKKGGFKYFWGKYKKLSVVAIAIILVLIAATNLVGGGVTQKSDGYLVFAMTKNEFVKKYNNAYYKLAGDEYKPSKNPFLDKEQCAEYSIGELGIARYPNLETLYKYDTTHGEKSSVVDIYTDKKGKIIAVDVTKPEDELGTDEAMDSFISKECAAALSSLTGKSNDDALKIIENALNNAVIEKNDNYECVFMEYDKKINFAISIIN